MVPLSYEPLSSVSSCICPHVPSPLSNPASVSRPVFRGDVSNVCCCGGGQWFLCHMDPSRLFPRVFVFNLGYNTSVCRPLFRWGCKYMVSFGPLSSVSSSVFPQWKAANVT